MAFRARDEMESDDVDMDEVTGRQDCNAIRCASSTTNGQGDPTLSINNHSRKSKQAKAMMDKERHGQSRVFQLMAIAVAMNIACNLHYMMDARASSPKFLAPSSEEKASELNKDGWRSIHVFYGDSEHDAAESTLAVPSYAQHQQDDLVHGLLNGKTSGYFIDLAANDATWISNTYKLERAWGWKGLCIEPNPIFWKNLSALRTCTVVAAVVGAARNQQHAEYNSSKVQFHMRDESNQPGLGGIVGDDFDNKQVNQSKSAVETVYTVPLENVLQRFHAPQVVDYFSLDIEGAEYYVMKEFPFDVFRFRIMTVERPTQELVDLFYNHSYQYIGARAGDETVWVHELYLDSINRTALEQFGYNHLNTSWMSVPGYGGKNNGPPRPQVLKSKKCPGFVPYEVLNHPLYKLKARLYKSPCPPLSNAA